MSLMARAVFETTKKYSIGAQMAAFNILNPEGNYGYSDKFVNLVPYSFVFYIEEQKIRSYLSPGGRFPRTLLRIQIGTKISKTCACMFLNRFLK